MSESDERSGARTASFSTAQIAVLQNQLSASGCIVHEPGSNGYAQATRLWNGAVERKPVLVAACSEMNHVRSALLAAQAAGLPLSVRNGGQDWVGRALRDGGLVLDLAPMRQCSVNVEAVEATTATCSGLSKAEAVTSGSSPRCGSICIGSGG